MLQKQNLDRASQELYRRMPDETFDSLSSLFRHCQKKKEESSDQWQPPLDLKPRVGQGSSLRLGVGDGRELQLNDWSFGQMCQLAKLSKETVNRLSPDTASKVFAETLPRGSKPMQLFMQGNNVRSIHGASYTRLFDADLLAMLQEFAVDFQPPQVGVNEATGLYAGEQDLFCFLIDPTGWVEIEGEAFAPGFFVFNSEVGKRSIGIQTFWFQAVCQNHIVWDAVEVIDYTRKHTSGVHEAFREIRRLVEQLVEKRDSRRDSFAKVIGNAMRTKLGDDADEVLQQVLRHGVARGVAKQALDIAQREGRLTIFSLVDAITRVTGKFEYAGSRNDADQKAGSLLGLAAV